MTVRQKYDKTAFTINKITLLCKHTINLAQHSNRKTRVFYLFYHLIYVARFARSIFYNHYKQHKSIVFCNDSSGHRWHHGSSTRTPPFWPRWPKTTLEPKLSTVRRPLNRRNVCSNPPTSRRTRTRNSTGKNTSHQRSAR